MVMRVGVIGLSDGNGHPFSFSAIINGYDKKAFEDAGWSVILSYLEAQNPVDFGIDGVKVTHAWTQDANLTDMLCRACQIPNSVRNLKDMVPEIDALLLARDDFETHLSFAQPFLEAGKYVFIDKPLCLKPSDLLFFEPYLKSGQLVSASGFRYARELDDIRSGEVTLGSIKMIHGAVLNGMPKYGIHLLEAVAGIGMGLPVDVERSESSPETTTFTLSTGVPFVLSCLGDSVGKTFHLGIYGTSAHYQADLHDNFSAFRRLLQNTFKGFQTSSQPIEPEETLALMAALHKAA